MTNSRPLPTNDPLFVLTGPVHSGKTTFLRDAAARWKASGLDVGGFLSVLRADDGRDRGYDLFELKEGTSLPFLAHEGEPDWPSVGTWYVFPPVLEKAVSILIRDSGADVLIVDEIGPLELGGEGLWPAFRKALESGARCLCVVREGILDSFREKIGSREALVFRHRAPGAFESLTAALSAVRAERNPSGEGA
jgi:nucleoside-triphosphatase